MSKPNDWFGIKCDKHQDQLLYVLNVIFQQQKKKPCIYACKVTRNLTEIQKRHKLQ